MLVKTFASAVQGVNARTITIEIHTGGKINPGEGNPIQVVGLPDKAVSEGIARVKAAAKNVGYRIPSVHTVINLAPADIRKEGSSYDLPLALGLLAGTEQIPAESLDQYLIMGELSLDGSLRPIRGALPIAIQARKEKFRGMIVPKQVAREAAIVNDVCVYGVENLREAVSVVSDEGTIEPTRVETRDEFAEGNNVFAVDFSDVRGQENVKRALTLAAAGGHNAILIGPPGAGKTMLARRMPTILPPFSLHEALETTKIHSVAGTLPEASSLLQSRPFRAPHHTVSDVALVGGGSNPMPGEISLAHNGVLFLDELPEFKRSVLEVMRQPMEERRVTISRAKISVDYPANFMLVASMNPCPCGYFNHPDKDCVCAPGVVSRYLNKISGPLLDRIDLHVEVTPVSYDELASQQQEKETSETIRARVLRARAVQAERFRNYPRVHANAQMPTRLVRQVCKLNDAGRELLKKAMTIQNLSARAYDRILKVARTSADLDGQSDISVGHLAEAIQYRSLDREGWVA